MVDRARRKVGRTRLAVRLAPLLLVVVAACSPSDAVIPAPELPPTTTPPATTTMPDTSDTTTSTMPDTSDPSEPPSITITTADDANEIITANQQPGAVFTFAPGVHRGVSVRLGEGVTIQGEEGAVISGAVELTEPDAGDGRWTYRGFERTGSDHGECVPDYDGCTYTQDVFVDDVMLLQVTDEADLGPGRWLWDDDGIHIADDPSGRRIELSVAEFALYGWDDDVVIRDLVVEKYATPAQLGAIMAQQFGDGEYGGDWLIDNVEVHGVHGAGVRTGDRTIVRNSYLHHNGQMGITVSGGSDVLIEDNEFAFNNVAGFAWGWEAGASKFTRTERLVVRGNHSHDNNGPGLWTDIDNVDTLYEDNLVEDNLGPGIFHEISYAAVIRNNVVTGNGDEDDLWLWGSGILVAASSGVEVYGNEVRNNTNGISGIQQDRGEGPLGPYLLDDLDVHDNIIELGGGAMGVVEDADPTVFQRTIRFDANIYEGAVGQGYRWDGGRLTRTGWQRAGFDENGIWR